MKKQYIIFNSAVIAIIFLQIFFIKSLYDNYILKENEHIGTAITQAIDFELLSRSINNKQNVEFVQGFIPIYEMPKKMLDSILAVNPPPKSPPKFNYDIRELISDGIITSSSEIDFHLAQDEYYEIGLPINIDILDSLLNANLGRGYPNKIIIMDSSSNVVNKMESNSDIIYNYIYDIKQIGFKGHQFLQIEVFFPLSNFIKQSIWIFILSFIIILIPLISLLLQLTTIRKKTKQLEVSEQSINGTIHDLKSPLSNIISMLSLLRITEPDLERKETIKTHSKIVDSVIKKVESLLDIARYNKHQIIICKENTNIDAIIETTNLVKTNLVLSYAYKGSIINIENRILHDKILYIDVIHYESILRNLVENALKYSNTGVNITITLNIDSKNQLVITVVDNGFGINKKHIKHLFKQFYRVHQKESTIMGHGIGLSYAKAVAIAHGGSIGVQSSEGMGSKFEVKLNIEKK